MIRQSKEASEPGSGMTGMLELSAWEFKTLLIYTVMALMDTVDSMQGQMHNVSGEVESLRIKEHE